MSKNYRFFNRELSWIEFNARVLSEAASKDVPLFERLKFLSIVTSNFDEFFMVRVASLKRQARKSPDAKDCANMTATEQLAKISERVHELLAAQYKCLTRDVLPRLQKVGIEYVPHQKYTPKQTAYVKSLFQNEIFPLLTPMRTDSNMPFPHVSNLKLHAAFLLKPMFQSGEQSFSPQYPSRSTDKQPLAIVQIPSGINRIVWLPSERDGHKPFTILDDVIQVFGTNLFPGYSVLETLLFKVTRDADFSVDEERDSDFIQAMQEVLERRQTSLPVRLVCTDTSTHIRQTLTQKLALSEQDVYCVESMPDLSVLSDIAALQGYQEHKYPAWKHFNIEDFTQNPPWDVLKRRDVLLHVPYQSYDPVLSFLSLAADDADTLAIKITLYRTSGNSPIVHTLERAARNGKHVTAFVELKARFDEQQNISWANRLENAGVIVVYGIANLKVHAKMLLVVRRETEGIRRYVHLSTGNYNDSTAKTYADMSVFTAHAEITNDATVFFNMISGYSAIQTMKRLVMAPIDLKSKLLTLIEREIQHAKQGTSALIMAKMNSLGHEEIIRALYRASCAGVKIMLNVRGICMLVPGVKGMSENITVVSVIDRYLEHTRIFSFQNGGDEELYLSSADWMPRNLERRVELMFPVIQKDIANEIKGALTTYFADNCKAHYLKSSGKWSARTCADDEEAIRAQESFYTHFKKLSNLRDNQVPREFVVRRNGK